MGEIIAAIIAACAALTTTGIGLGVSAKQKREENATNVNLANTQFTRSAADAVEAGFSPLVATGLSPSNVTVSSNADNTSSLLGSLGKELGTDALGVGKMSFEGKENKREREIRMLMQDKVLAQKRDEILASLRSNENIAQWNNATATKIAQMQNETVKRGQDIGYLAEDRKLTLTAQELKAKCEQWSHEFDLKVSKMHMGAEAMKENRARYITTKILEYTLPTANQAAATLGSVFGAGNSSATGVSDGFYNSWISQGGI